MIIRTFRGVYQRLVGWARRSRAQSTRPAVAPSSPRLSSMVTTNHAVRWSEDGLLIHCLDRPDVPLIDLALTHAERVWTSDGGERRVDAQHSVIVRRNAAAPVELGSWSDSEIARSEFERLGAELVREVTGMGHAAEPRQGASTAAVERPRSWSRRMLASLGPWLGGALAVVVASLLLAPADPSRSAPAGQSPPAPVSLYDNEAPEAWNKLPPEVQRILMDAATKAAAMPADPASAAMPGAAAAAVGTPAATGSSPFDAGGALTPGQPPSASTMPVPVAQAQGGAAGKPFALTADQMKAFSGATVLKFGAGKKWVYVFEDPLCVACQHFARNARALGPDFSIQVLPVAFNPGAMDLAARAVCEKDPVRAWEALMEGGLSIDGSACPAGVKKVEANNALFLKLGLRATPTMVARGGAVVDGSGETAAIAYWINKHAAN